MVCRVGPDVSHQFSLQAAALITWLSDTNEGIGQGQECARVAWMSSLNAHPHHFPF